MNAITVTQLDNTPQVTVYGPSHMSINMPTLINAPIDVVWATATDFDNMDWSPSYYGINGTMESGATVTGFIRNPEEGDMKVDFTWCWIDGRRFGWNGLAPTGLPVFDNHQFVFTPISDNQTLLVQSDDVTSHDAGAVDLSSEEMVDAIKGLMNTMYIPFNDALKVEAERRFGAA